MKQLTLEELAFLKAQAEEDIRAYLFCRNSVRPNTPIEVINELENKVKLWETVLEKVTQL